MNVINVRKITSPEVNSVFKQIVRRDKVGLEAHLKDVLMDKINWPFGNNLLYKPVSQSKS